MDFCISLVVPIKALDNEIPVVILIMHLSRNSNGLLQAFRMLNVKHVLQSKKGNKTTNKIQQKV